ncbi:DExH-box ATP-dependent RNA helicase DExH9 [Dichanthelium oligosanthes]|uniref:DExH-box ATP-dependent RNA helicase DExH9 n=1 Tax=Dichanthelium oligosanthes TaxID=888268 RepID=A0A1E5UR46_9POAL|nr:DExH-box ATP-dependent RNA helicase DExH9 [Dichanthelium oligosanthes]
METLKRKAPDGLGAADNASPLKAPRADAAEPVACVHDVSYPEGYDASASASRVLAGGAEGSEPAKKFPFQLDPFQAEAIRCVDNGESVMVSAHTSAGKTVVALYAIAMSLRNQQRVIYTSPIKALSNQKYREFKEEFSDVGLMTGDVTIEPNASCLVMTTEIWRSMQYKGSEVMKEVAWVIFDEVHYMRDRERGVVWEESIVMAPKNSRFVFLSATVPNAKEFADWVAKACCETSLVHKQPCHIVYTDYRPTPLQHYVFPSGGDGLYLVVDEKAKFREDSFQKALNALVPASDSDKKKENGKWQKGIMAGKSSEESDIFKMVKMIIQRQYDPVILFSFSKRECEFLAMQCLFATETFSIGLNMPAKTVVFTNVRKFDGDRFRWLSSGEYIQMSGRAGRRGIDQRGICILMVDEKMEPSTAKMMLKGSADSLNSAKLFCSACSHTPTLLFISAFHLSYNMLLNQMRSEDGDPEKLLRYSFYQFQADRALPDLETGCFHLLHHCLLVHMDFYQNRNTGTQQQSPNHFMKLTIALHLNFVQKQIKELESDRNSMVIEEEESLKDYYDLLQQYKSLKKDVRDIVLSPKHVLPFLQPGRLVRLECVTDELTTFSLEENVTWGIIINFEKVKFHGEDRRPEDSDYTVDVLTRCSVSKDSSGKKAMKVVALKEPGEPVVVSLPLSQIDGLSSIRMYIPKDLLPVEGRENTLRKVEEVLSRFAKDGVPLLDPEEDMKVQSKSFRKATRRIEALESLFEKHDIRSSPHIQQKLKVLHAKQELSAKIKSIKKTVRSSTALAFNKDELKARKRVLRRLGYVTSDDVAELKGKVACEISSADELTLTELMFSGTLKDATVEQMVALLSCFVWQEKLQDAPKPREELDLLFYQLQETARRVANLQLECKIQIDVESFVNSFRPDIMEAVCSWARGSKFYQIMEMTQVFEGSLIRAIRRLEEVLQQLILASKSIGETELEAKLEEAVSKIKRDIVFAASLYL